MRCTSNARECMLREINARSRDLNTRPLLATSLNPFYNV